MEVYNCIKTRRSIRKYQDKVLPWDLIAKVIDAGRLAPSAGNLQSWKFVVIQDEGKRGQVAEACLHQDWMAKAPIQIIICSEPVNCERYYGARGDRLCSVQNCAAATENMLLMAHSLGLGACWVGAFDENMIGNIIGLPSETEIRPQVIITLGYPNEKPAEPSKYPLENVTYLGGWKSKIRDIPAYAHYYSDVWAREAKKGKALVGKKMKKAAEKAKDIGKKIKKKIEDKQKKQKDLKEFKKIYNLK